MERHQSDAPEQAAVFPAWTIGGSSMASFGPCGQARSGVICPKSTGPVGPATIDLSAGDGPACVWDQIMEALAAAHDAAVQMIDTSVVRVHQHGVCIAGKH